MTDMHNSESGVSSVCRIRPASPEDADTIAAYNRAMAQESEGHTLDPAIVTAGVRAVLDDPARGTYFVAQIDGQSIGQALVTCEWSDWRNGWFWWLQSVYVHPEHRRRGVFRALYEYISRAARDRGDVCGIRLYVDRNNASAISTYVALGLAHTRYVVHENDWWVAVGPG